MQLHGQVVYLSNERKSSIQFHLCRQCLHTSHSRFNSLSQPASGMPESFLSAGIQYSTKPQASDDSGRARRRRVRGGGVANCFTQSHIFPLWNFSLHVFPSLCSVKEHISVSSLSRHRASSSNPPSEAESGGSIAYWWVKSLPPTATHHFTSRAILQMKVRRWQIWDNKASCLWAFSSMGRAKYWSQDRKLWRRWNALLVLGFWWLESAQQ